MNIIAFLKNLFKRPSPPPPPRPDNTGVIIGNQPTDYFVGAANNPIGYLARLPSGNWLPYAWSKVVQWCWNNGQYVDLMDCVTNSVITAIETQEYWMTGQKVKYSRRWIAKMSGTTRQGNYLYKVADAVRAYGLVSEQDYPTPSTYTWDEFYADIAEPTLSQLKTKGQEWLKTRQLQYEFLQVNDPNIDYHLKHAPIVVVVPGHAVCGIYSPNEYTQYRDSYEPFDKQTLSDSLQSAMKVILTDTRIIMRKVGWIDQEKGIYVGFDTLQRQASFFDAMASLFPDYRTENKEWNLGKRPW